QEEYVWNGKLNVRLKVHTVCSVERIQKGDFKVPPIKKYEGEITSNNAAPTSYTPFSSVNDADIPF
ncbi:hypothetical protein, partial [Phascolarctobacterium succinatutens]|uniref:hypothetical protein n=1 Tax=Phascolarctobacterium succinatutens TaxID=626940 RepID=UPI0040295FBB